MNEQILSALLHFISSPSCWMFLLYVCAHKWLFLSTSAPDDCLLTCALGYFALFPLLPRGCWSGVMILVCHLVIGLFPYRTSFIVGTECTYFGPICPQSPGLQVTCGNACSPFTVLCVSRQGGSHCTVFPCLLPLSISFLPSFNCSICLLSEVGKKREQTIC